ncbi:MAG: glycosyl transferase family 1, partial [Verrucomicrobiota bacterium JB023]|nr:glycosyl transferase family 1 [Verrucomicrobiota bacterium JB023]
MKVLRVIASMDPKTGGPPQGIRNLTPSLQKSLGSVEVVCVDNPEAGYLGDDPFRITALGPSQKFWSYSKKLEPWLRENL